MTISTTGEFDDLLTGCDGEWRFHLIKPASSSPASGPASGSAGATAAGGAFLVYLHGGYYVATAQPAHFTFLYDLCARTGATILMPIYPRPPSSKVSHVEILDVVGRVVERLRESSSGNAGGEATSAARQARKFSIGGDSAGGGMTMGVVLWLIKNRKQKLLPGLILLNAPWLDVSLSTPEMQKYDAIVRVPLFSASHCCSDRMGLYLRSSGSLAFCRIRPLCRQAMGR